MTDGIPARRSVALWKKMESFPEGKYSPRKKAIDKEKGRLINTPRTAVITVPTRKGRAPNCCRKGSQVLVKRKESPEWRNTGMACMTSVTHKPDTSISVPIAHDLTTALNKVSDNCFTACYLAKWLQYRLSGQGTFLPIRLKVIKESVNFR